MGHGYQTIHLFMQMYKWVVQPQQPQQLVGCLAAPIHGLHGVVDGPQRLCHLANDRYFLRHVHEREGRPGGGRRGEGRSPPAAIVFETQMGMVDRGAECAPRPRRP